MERSYKNATEAFEALYTEINYSGERSENGTRRILNVGFYIQNPLDNRIKSPFRKWNIGYAIREFEWYLSRNRSVSELKKFAPIWDKMHGGDNIVNSNYGYLWNENNQLHKTIQKLFEDPNTRQAWITLFDGKNKDQYEYDTPCTLNIGFSIEKEKLNMTILMRSNDLWYGFCNDQFCFSSLQEVVAGMLDLEVGWYYHYAADMHLYADQFNKDGQLKLDLDLI